MDAQTMDLVKRSAQASVRYATLAGVGLVVLNLLSKIPFIGLAFSCLLFFGALGAAAGIAYLIAPKMTNLPYGQSKPMLALWIGLGVAIPLMVALVITNLIGTFWDIFANHYTLIGSLFSIIGAIVGGLIGGLLVGTALAWVGGFFSLDRNPYLAAATQPPPPPYPGQSF